MKRGKDKKQKKIVPEVKPQAKEDRKTNPFGGIPNQDLKKLLGCG